MNNIMLAILLIVLVLCVSFFGSELGYTVDGVPQKNADMLDYIGAMYTFSIDGMPVWLNIFLDLIPVLSGWLVYREIRGNS